MRGLVFTGTGLLIGLPVTLGIVRLLASIIFGEKEYDPAMQRGEPREWTRWRR